MDRIENSELYNNQYNRFITFKVNKDLKAEVGKVLKKNNIKWQDWLDDSFREYLTKNGIKKLPPKIRKIATNVQ